MEILFLSEHFPPLRGGTATYTWELTKKMCELGEIIHILTYNFGKFNYPILKNMHLHRISVQEKLRKERYFPIFALMQAIKIIKKNDIDAIHVGCGHYAIFLGTLLGKIFRKPVVFTVHNIPPEEQIVPIFKTNETFKKFFLQMTKIFGEISLKLPYDKLICVSTHTKNLAIDRGVSEDKIVVIPNGIDISEFDEIKIDEKNKNSRLMLNVAGPAKRKGQEYLINIIPNILEEFPNTKFLFIGPIRDEEYFRYLKEKVTSLQIEDCTEFTGSIPREKVVSYYKKADIYVQPSLKEGFCISVLEALASGTPVVGTSVGEIPTILSKSYGGIIVPPSDEPKLFDAILELLRHPEKAKKMGDEGKDYVLRNYTWEKIAKNTINLYQCLII